MASIMFVPVKTAVQTLCCLRMLVAVASITWISLNNPDTDISGYLGDLLALILPDIPCTYLTIIIPALITEVLIDIIFLIGVGQHSRPWLIPWLVINFLIFICLIVTVILNCAQMLVGIDLVYADHVNTSDEDKSLMEIKTFLRILSLNMISMGQLLNFSAGLKQFIDMRYKRRISFSKKVEKKEVPKMNCELYDEEKAHLATLSFPSIDEVSPLFDDESKNLNVMITLDEEGSKSDSWEEKDTVSFTYDKVNFE